MNTLTLPESELLRFDYDRYNPYRFHFEKLDWMTFGTVTWKDEERRTISGELLRQKDFGNLLATACREFRIKSKRLPYYRCMEYGKGDCHYHFLIAKEGLEHIAPDEFAAFLQEQWQSKLTAFGTRSEGVGRADIRPYDRARGAAGVLYCLKREFDGKGNELDRIEFLSKGLSKVIERQNQVSMAA
jgi:hypothetical protein